MNRSIGRIVCVRALKRLQSRPTDDRNVIAGEIVLAEKLTHLKLNQIQKLLIVNHVHFVHEHNDSRNTNLSRKKDMLSSLRHGAVSSGHNKNSAVHLGSTCDHVLHIVSVTWAIDVRVVALSGLVLDVSRIDCDSTLFLFRGLIDLVKASEISELTLAEVLRDSCGEGGFPMINMTDGTNVAVRFSSFEFFFRHGRRPPSNWA